MKMTFEVPDKIGAAFRQLVPSGKRSGVISQAMARAAREAQDNVVKACRQANRLKAVNGEMAEWEKFDDSDA